MATASTISQEAMDEFLAECDEIAQRVSLRLTALESGKREDGDVDSVYRDTHTMKGSAQLFGFAQVGRIAHVMETSLDPFRKSKAVLGGRLVDALFECLDTVESLVAHARTQRQEPSIGAEVDRLISKVIEVVLRDCGGALPLYHDSLGVPESVDRDRVNMPLSMATQVLASIEKKIQEEEKQREASMESNIQAAAVNSSVPLAAVSAEDSAHGDATSTIRVQVDLLDNLMTLVGEMVLVRNQVLQFSNQNDDLEFLKLSQRLNLVTSELQSEVMKTRMQPVGNILSKFQRVTRDIAKELGKSIEFVMHGNETELDKTLIEAVKDPLTHIIRNSCDHGIEIPEERTKVGKPEAGTISIRSYHEGGQVIIEIVDDGRGLNRERLSAKALERGLISKERLSQLSEKDIFNFIFLPGFSTAQKVTTVSGRGVGMDVVKTNIEKIGGIVDLSSVSGKGTTIRLKIPLTLAIVPALIVKSGSERFAIPQVKLVELVRLEGGERQSGIEMLQGKPMYRLRGNLLPLVSLAEVLSFGAAQNLTQVGAAQAAATDDAKNIVVLDAEGQMFGLIVDEIQDTADIVVKPLSQFLKSIAAYSGATVMGDGSVALILDAVGVAHLAQLHNQSKEVDEFAANERTAKNVRDVEIQEYLLFRVSAPGKFAIPLCLVHRLEEFPRKAVEYSGSQPLVRYRESLLPLISVNRFLKFAESAEVSQKDTVFVVVVQWHERFFGIEVDSILDVVKVERPLDDGLRDRAGICGNLIVGDEVIVVVDSLQIIEAEHVRMSQGAPSQKLQQPVVKGTKKPHILIAEDSPFFRRQVTRLLERSGYQVTSAENGAAALKKLESLADGEVTLVLSDLEMPLLNGFQLAEAIRKQDRWKNVPLIALSTRPRSKDEGKAKAAGFQLFLEKLNEGELLTSLNQLLDVPAAKGGLV